MGSRPVSVHWVRRMTGKTPENLSYKDFERYDAAGFLKQWCGENFKVAIEFRYPGTYPDLGRMADSLWEYFGHNGDVKLTRLIKGRHRVALVT